MRLPLRPIGMALVSTMRVACLGLALAAGVQSSFVPFADVEGLKPQRLEQFCSKEFLPTEDGRGRLRSCTHHVKTQLEDGGEVELGWTMNADPDSILSLDTEAEHGVRLSKCTPEVIELELPASHLHHAEVGKIVVGSSFVHGCKHMQGSNFLHRIKQVGKRYMAQDRTMHRVQLSAEPLKSLGHAVPYLNFHFSYMPLEATNLVEYPDMVTDWGANRPHLKNKGARRLDGGILDSLREQLNNIENRVQNIDTVPGVSRDDGGFQAGGQTSSSFDTANSFLNLQPKQISNFGWNWNFYMNTSEATFAKEAKGMEGIFHLEETYIKVHAGIYLNFTSEFTGITAAPKVKWTGGIKGHGAVNAKVDAALNSTFDADVAPAEVFNLDFLTQLEHPQWFSEIEFATGALPIKMEPGFQFQAHLYHKGQFDGKLSFGGKTHGTIHPSLTYDSETGITANFKEKLLDSKVIPPMWLIFTKQFEMGLFGRPALLLRGDFAGMEKATLKIEALPYINISIEENATVSAPQLIPQPSGKLLTAYPFRVSGIEELDFNTRYKVTIEAFNLTRTSSAELNWGHVEFHDRPSRWGFNRHEEPVVLDQTFKVTLIKVNSASGTPVEETMGTGLVECQSILNGECQPTPSTAVIQGADGQTVAAVDLVIIWEDEPEPWFASKVRGIGMGVNEVSLNEANLEQSFPHIAASQQSAMPSSFSLRLVYAGRTLVLPLNAKNGSSDKLEGTNVLDFGPTILQNWLPCSAPCKTPRLDLYYGTTKVGQRDLPQFQFSSQTAMQGTGGSFMAPHQGGHVMNVPASVPLYAAGGSTTNTIALVDLNMEIDLPMASSLFLMPNVPLSVQQGSTQAVAWTVADVDQQQEYDFKLETYKLITVDDADMQNYINNNQINGKVLDLVTTEDLKQECESRATHNLSIAEAPCSFEDDVELAADKFQVDDLIVIKISWTVAGKTHTMISPAVNIVAPPAAPAVTARRLSYEDAGLPGDVSTWTPADYESHLLQRRREGHLLGSCPEAEPLSFELGGGMMVRGVVEEFSLPEGYPMIGGMEAPNMKTEWKTVSKIETGDDIASDLGGNSSILCQSGLCSGRLPTCQTATESPVLLYPTLVFAYSTAILSFPVLGAISELQENVTSATNDDFKKEMKIAMAYAFSTMPELIDIAIKETQRRQAEAGGVASTPTASPIQQNPVWNNPAANVAPQVTHTTQDGSTNDGTGTMNEWWGGPSGLDNRRLTSVDGVGSKEELPSELTDHQVRVHFKGGLPFVVDRKLLQMMQTSGQLKAHVDSHVKSRGPLELTSFWVDSGLPENWRKTGEGHREQGRAQETATAQYIAVLACCVMLVGVVLAKRGPSRARYVATYEVSDEAVPCGLE